MAANDINSNISSGSAGKQPDADTLRTGQETPPADSLTGSVDPKEQAGSLDENSTPDITELGNPGKPRGEAGRQMLERMNDSHYQVTGWALDKMDLAEARSILDIGCGSGLTLSRMAEAAPEAHLTGVDYSPVSVRLTEETNRPYIDTGRMDVTEASVSRMPFDDGSFDRIITVESFYFWPEPEEDLKEVRRVLGEGGRFFLVMDIFENGKLSEHARSNMEKYDLFVPTIGEFHRLFEAAGFSETSIHTVLGRDWICVEGVK